MTKAYNYRLTVKVRGSIGVEHFYISLLEAVVS